MGGLSWWHWLIIIGVFVILFGAKRLPDTARGVGRSMRILKSEVSAMQDDTAPTLPGTPTSPTITPVAAATTSGPIGTPSNAVQAPTTP